MASAALRVAFGLIWVVDAALTWTPKFAAHYVGYLHNAAAGQAAWSAWWFDMWIAIVTPHAMLFVWLTRLAETTLAIALLFGVARKTTYVLGALFSLLVWSTAEGFGGPYSVGAANMGTALVYVLVFIALITLNYRAGSSPYSLDALIERRFPRWRLLSEWSTDTSRRAVRLVPWSIQLPALLGIAAIVFFLVAGLHSSFNVQAPSPTAAAAAVSPLALASSKPVAQARDARLPPLQDGPSIDVKIAATDRKVEIASGVYYSAWTFGDEVPGPVIHVRQGQTVNVSFTNNGTMHHSIDFHAAETAPSSHYVDIDPGQTIHFSFKANVPGAFLYHCGTPPVLLHIGNGMYGALIVDPVDDPLPPAAESYVLVQGEWYTQQLSGTLMGPSFAKMLAERADEVVFNGTAFQYKDHPLAATAGERVRLYVVDAGPSLWSSFHVIGAIFDRVYTDGATKNALHGVSTYGIPPGAGAIFDVILPEPGDYAFVDHNMAHVAVGAVGVLRATASDGTPPAQPNITQETAAAPVAPPAAAGPYAFNPDHGAELYAKNCAACHQATGMGLPGAFPPLKGNAAVLDPDPTQQISAVLHGLQGVAIDGVTYPSPMPPFGAALNDHDIADIVNHERSSWGNQARHVTAEQVKSLREKAK